MLTRRIALMLAAAVCAIALQIIAPGNSAAASEVRLQAAVALKGAITPLISDFEKSSGHTVTAGYGTAGAVADRVRGGSEAVDVVITAAPLMNQLQAQGKVESASRVNVAKVGIGVFVRKNSAKPDLTSVDGFKRSLLAAKFIAYPDPASGGPAAIYVAGMIERLGIAAEMKPKTKLFPASAAYFENVARGDIDFAFDQVSAIMDQPSVEFAGPLPAAIQNYTQFVAAIVTNSSQPDASGALIRSITSAAAQSVLKTRGFE